jgi:hypothetical protein
VTGTAFKGGNIDTFTTMKFPMQSPLVLLAKKVEEKVTLSNWRK